jgi:hypothetical protein
MKDWNRPRVSDMRLNVADTCRDCVSPKRREAERVTLPPSLTEQPIFTDGRVVQHARATALHKVKTTRFGWFDRMLVNG